MPLDPELDVHRDAINGIGAATTQQWLTDEPLETPEAMHQRARYYATQSQLKMHHLQHLTGEVTAEQWERYEEHQRRVQRAKDSGSASQYLTAARKLYNYTGYLYIMRPDREASPASHHVHPADGSQRRQVHFTPVSSPVIPGSPSSPVQAPVIPQWQQAPQPPFPVQAPVIPAPPRAGPSAAPAQTTSNPAPAAVLTPAPVPAGMPSPMAWPPPPPFAPLLPVCIPVMVPVFNARHPPPGGGQTRHSTIPPC